MNFTARSVLLLQQGVADFVLRKPPAAERQAIEDCIARSLKALEPLLKGDMAQATRLIHTQPSEPGRSA